MNKIREELEKELEPYKNTLVISEETLTIVRLVDVLEGEYDYFWVFDTAEKNIFSNCLGYSWIPLKGIIKDSKYNWLLKLWNIDERNVVKAI